MGPGNPKLFPPCIGGGGGAICGAIRGGTRLQAGELCLVQLCGNLR